MQVANGLRHSFPERNLERPFSLIAVKVPLDGRVCTAGDREK